MLLHSGFKLHPPLNDTICESAMTLLMICLTLYHHLLLLLAELSFFYHCVHVYIRLHPARLVFYLKCFHILSKHLLSLYQAFFM